MIEFILKSIGVLLIIYTSIIYFVLKELNKIDFMDDWMNHGTIGKVMKYE